MVRRRARTTDEPAVSHDLVTRVWKQSMPLRREADLDPLLERIGEACVVLLGEASHGTHEFYTWRTALSRRLIEEKGFRFLGVEGGWPDCNRVNRYVKGYTNAGETAREVLHAFERWPTWMWANCTCRPTWDVIGRKPGLWGFEPRVGFRSRWKDRLSLNGSAEVREVVDLGDPSCRSVRS